MAALLGGVQGSRGAETRLGSSQMHVWAKTWGRQIDVYLHRDGSYSIRVKSLPSGSTEHLYQEGPES